MTATVIQFPRERRAPLRLVKGDTDALRQGGIKQQPASTHRPWNPYGGDAA